MKLYPRLATILGAALVAGCTIQTEGLSFSETSWVDNNCTGNGGLADPDYCTGTLRASGGPWAFRAGEG